MKKTNENLLQKELIELCNTVRNYVHAGEYEKSIKEICLLMEQFPHAPQPHNLLGVVMEKMGDHSMAMKHFRAALSLDPSYLPADYNLNTYGTLFSYGRCAFDESDISQSYLKEKNSQHGKKEFR